MGGIVALFAAGSASTVQRDFYATARCGGVQVGAPCLRSGVPTGIGWIFSGRRFC